MQLRHWAGLVTFSILLHAVFLWPLPDPIAQGDQPTPLEVSLPAVIESSPSSTSVHITGVEESQSKRFQETKLSSVAAITPHSAPRRSTGSKNVVAREELFKPVEAVSTKHEEKTPSEIGIAPNILKDDSSPSISRYRLALAAEVIRTRESIEKLIQPGFKGRLVVLVQLHKAGASPQVSLEQGAGLEALDQEVLIAFRRAAAVVPVSMAGDVGQVSFRLPVDFDQLPHE